MLSSMWSNWNCHALLGAGSKMVPSLWKTAVSYIVKHMLTINSVILLLGIYQTGKKDLYANDHKKYIHDSANL